MTCIKCGGELVRIDERENVEWSFDSDYIVTFNARVLRCEECSEDHDHHELREKIMERVRWTLTLEGRLEQLNQYGYIPVNSSDICGSGLDWVTIHRRPR